MTLTTEEIIEQTQLWITNVIIAFDFCPFAKRELERASVYYKVIHDSDQDMVMASALESFMTECFRLDAQPEIETSFLIFSNNFTEFSFFLELVFLTNELLVTQNYEGIYQIASFHPEYCFADKSQDDASNFTNRSPFPMLHLLRESSITLALENYPEPDQISLRNIEKSRKLGNKVFQKLLEKCTK